MAKGQLKNAMIHCLAHETLSGYEIMKRIHAHSGSWKPSFGSIYPHLKKMHDEGFLKTKKDGRKILYTLTPKGRESISENKEEDRILLKELIGRCKLFSGNDKTFADEQLALWDATQSKDNPFKGIEPAIIDIKKIFFKLYNKGKIKGNEKKINAIIKKTIHELGQL